MKKYFILSFIGLILASCGNTMRNDQNYFPAQINLENYNNLQFVKIKQGKSIKVNVNENQSTGFHWDTQLVADCSVSISDGGYAQGGKPDVVGAGGVKTFEVKGDSKGTCLVEFQNIPPGGSEPQERKAIYFVVE